MGLGTGQRCWAAKLDHASATEACAGWSLPSQGVWGKWLNLAEPWFSIRLGSLHPCCGTEE